jgi:hypothetical protein
MVGDMKGGRLMEHYRSIAIPALIVFVFLTCSCGTSSTESPSNESGSVKFSIDVAEKVPAAMSPGMAETVAVDCERMRIDTVTAELRDSQNNLIATGGPWPCSTRQGTLTEIPAGEGYTLIIMMKDSNSNVRYQGYVYGILVPAAGTADAGTVTVTPVNNPPVITEIRGNKRITGGSGKMQLEVIATDPDGNNLTYYMTDLPESVESGYFSGATFDPDTHIFTWDTVEGAYETGEYFVWFIVTDDGEPRRSAWERCKIFVDPAGSTTSDMQLVLNTDDDTTEVVGRKFATPGAQFTMQLKDTSSPAHTGLNFSMTPEIGSLNETSGLYTWTPDMINIGNLMLIYYVSGNGAAAYESDWKKILLSVGGVNVCPLVEPLGTRRVMEINHSYEFYVTAEDPDSENLAFNAIGGAEEYSNPFEYGAAFDANTHMFSWTPPSAALEHTPFGVLFTVTDSSGASDFWAVSIDVIE